MFVMNLTKKKLVYRGKGVVIELKPGVNLVKENVITAKDLVDVYGTNINVINREVEAPKAEKTTSEAPAKEEAKVEEPKKEEELKPEVKAEEKSAKEEAKVEEPKKEEEPTSETPKAEETSKAEDTANGVPAEVKTEEKKADPKKKDKKNK